jgi:hypothetical protein
VFKAELGVSATVRRFTVRAAPVLASAVFAASGMCLVNGVAPASAKVYTPPPGKVFQGVTAGSSITPYENLVGHHPPVFERFVRWDTRTRWLAVRQSKFRIRRGVALTTAIAKYKRAVVSSEGIAVGRSDRFLVAMNRNIARSGRIVYVRIMPEMNGWWNPYCPYNHNGTFRGRAYSPHFFIMAWRRTVLILRGGPVWRINHRLHTMGLPPVRHVARHATLPRPKVAIMWVPQTRGDPEVPRNLPGVYWPGSSYVDWVGTDFFSYWHNWRWLTPFYEHYSGKPFELAEWGMLHGDRPQFVRDLFSWIRNHRRLRMFNYFQGYSTADPYNPIHYPKSMRMLRHELASPKFPQYAREYQSPPHVGRPGGGPRPSSPPPPG